MNLDSGCLLGGSVRIAAAFTLAIRVRVIVLAVTDCVGIHIRVLAIGLSIVGVTITGPSITGPSGFFPRLFFAHSLDLFHGLSATLCRLNLDSGCLLGGSVRIADARVLFSDLFHLYRSTHATRPALDFNRGYVFFTIRVQVVRRELDLVVHFGVAALPLKIS